MLSSRKVIVAIELGTSKTRVLVCQVNPNNSARILGCGESVTVGVKKGEVVDVAQARSSLLNALKEAETESNVSINQVYVSITGEHIKGFNHRCHYRLPEEEKIVTRDHVAEVCARACDVELPASHACLPPILKNYRLDDMEYAVQPLRLHGSKLEVEHHVIHGIKTKMQNSLSVMREAGLEIKAAAFAPIATAQMAITRQTRDLGALLIDIGGGTTDYALYHKGVLEASGCLGIGGDHVTNDIREMARCSFTQAETLKIISGLSTQGSSKMVQNDLKVRGIELHEVISARLEEIFELVKARLPEGVIPKLKGGIYFTGGTCKMTGFKKLAHEFFGGLIYLVEQDLNEDKISDVGKITNDPCYATCLGLIRYAQSLEKVQIQPKGIFSVLKSKFWPI